MTGYLLQAISRKRIKSNTRSVFRFLRIRIVFLRKNVHIFHVLDRIKDFRMLLYSREQASGVIVNTKSIYPKCVP